MTNAMNIMNECVCVCVETIKVWGKILNQLHNTYSTK